MELIYNNKSYELTELKEPNQKASFDIIAIFENQFIKIDTKEVYNKVELSEEEQTSGNYYSHLKFIDYFYGADDEELIKIAKEYIDLK